MQADAAMFHFGIGIASVGKKASKGHKSGRG